MLEWGPGRSEVGLRSARYFRQYIDFCAKCRAGAVSSLLSAQASAIVRISYINHGIQVQYRLLVDWDEVTG